MTGSANSGGPFPPAVIGFLVAGVVAIFALSVILGTIDATETPAGRTSDSPSAIGHMGFIELLKQLDLPVSRSRPEDVVVACGGDLLVVDEPDRDARDITDGGCDEEQPNVLVILPKWSGARDILHDGWVSHVEPLSPAIVRDVLHLVDRRARIVRVPATAAALRSQSQVVDVPALEKSVQLVAGSRMTPLIGTKDAMLLGETVAENRRIFLLSDPDPLENHAIGTPANARFAAALVAAARGEGGRIVFDETVHGVVAPNRDVLQLLFRFPFVIVTLEIVAAFALLLLATTTRFGGVEVPPPPFPLGKLGLVRTIAALMERAGHQTSILRRYVSMTFADAGRALHAPAGLDEAALAAWLDGVGRSRGIAARAGEIRARAEAGGPHILEEARAAYRLKKDFLR